MFADVFARARLEAEAAVEGAVPSPEGLKMQDNILKL
jgi:hypothetical protein